MMKWSGTSFVLLAVVFGLLLLDIEFATGLRCHECVQCPSASKFTERTCAYINLAESRSSILEGLGPGMQRLAPEFSNPPPGFAIADRCVKFEYKNGKVERRCSYQGDEAWAEQVGIKCDEFAEDKEVKLCFCSTDLCNGDEPPKAPFKIQKNNSNGNSKPLVILTVITFVFTYSIVNLFF